MTQIKFASKAAGTSVNFDCNPYCPMCNTSIFPSIQLTYENRHNRTIDAVMLCPNCENTYFERFYQVGDSMISAQVFPNKAPQINISDEICEHFPYFATIYREAAIAESLNLNSICGMGYRKAVEALVKQFVSELQPEEQDKILSEPLAQAIKRIDSPKVKQLATAATWLGNDQTHLVTKYPEYDVKQLKSFINFLCYYIQAEQEAEKALNLIQNR